ncbi:uncharacterized protein KIAA0513 isoform X2 [Teleopsis dalmanni]|uniref:uncharacterized protein KIAA0513 isoform X2 n=1 Tax=Teleopsis dalmanni TaxID=139649 RepID=UPI0018CDA377|nr:uncharacterized protein KIAA0513 isoform X2 [Teleopsis dalmanni]
MDNSGEDIPESNSSEELTEELTLSISSSDSDYCDDDEEVPKFDETIDYTKIDFESRRMKARRAHEEIISGRYRHPNLAPRPRLETTTAKSSGSSSSSSSSSSLSSSSISIPTNIIDRSHVSSTTRSNSIESRHSGGYGRPGRAIPGARRSDLDIKKDLIKINDFLSTGHNVLQIDVQQVDEKHNNLDVHQNIANTTMTNIVPDNAIHLPARSKISNSSTVTSLRDDPEMQISPSVESTDWINFIRSESQNSVPSWASSISLDCRAGEEPVKDFMKSFTDVLFTNPSLIGLELKSEFGTIVGLDAGRLWFIRFLLEHKNESKRVDEMTFHSLVQYFSIVLFECGEFEDYGPATIIMNLCFLFYHEIEVPGCDPYFEYLFTYMRQQPVWNAIRFWNAAFFDTLQSKREQLLLLKIKRAEKRRKNKEQAQVAKVDVPISTEEDEQTKLHIVTDQRHLNAENDASTSSSSHHNNIVTNSKRVSTKGQKNVQAETEKDQQSELRMYENVVFRLLSAFTCNMHSLGIPQDLCLDFLKKQATSCNLPKDKFKLVKDNIHRMYHETDLWGAKVS